MNLKSIFKGIQNIAGVDEVGRGSLIGPVYASAVILKKKPHLVLVDGNRIPVMKNYNLKYVIKGDQKIPQISAASIVAKVSRDSLMKKISKNFSKYQWNKNCGYGTKVHIQAIRKFGVTKHHRRTFKPIHNILSPR